ncbi:MAG: lamin tail domain-containing protein [Myxococcales bacterium]|nr:lamin tail domain-containing protein [Myxococcales bacterium]
MSRPSLLPVLAATACKVEIAPVPANGVLTSEERGRTALGERITLQASDVFGVTGLGAHIAIDGDQHSYGGADLLITEDSDGLCDRRIRRVDLGDGLADDPDDVTDCEIADPAFGHDLFAGDDMVASGSSVARNAYYFGDDMRIQAPGAAEARSYGSHAYARPDGWGQDEVLFVGTPTTNEVRVFDSYGLEATAHQTLSAPAHLPADAGFGARLWVLDEALVVADAVGGFHFYALDALTTDGLPTFVPAVGPVFTDVLAAHGDELLVARQGLADLDIMTLDPSGYWVTTDVLRGAATWGYTVWAFDEVAAFGARPRQDGQPGRVDRFTRLSGDIEASLPFVRPHEDLRLALTDHWLAVSEVGTDTVHVFDWKDERTLLFWDLDAPTDEVCMVREAPRSRPLELEDFLQTDGETMLVWGAVESSYAEDSGTWLSVYVPRGDTLLLDVLPGPDGGLPDVHLEAGDDSRWFSGPSWSSEWDGQVNLAWHNFGDGGVTATVRLHYSSTYDEECVGYEVRATVQDAPWNYCRDAVDVWDPEAPRDLLAAHGQDLLLGADGTETYEVQVPLGGSLDIVVEGDVRPVLVDVDGQTLTYGTRGELHWTPGWDDNRRAFLRVGASWDAERPACLPYTLDVSITDPGSLAPLLVNEIMGGNYSVDTNCDGRTNSADNYVELVNVSDAPLVLDGVTLSRFNATSGFTFPEGTTLPAGGATVVWTGTPSCVLDVPSFGGGWGMLSSAGVLQLDHPDGSQKLTSYSGGIGAKNRVLDGDPDSAFGWHSANGNAPFSPGTRRDGTPW